MKFPVGFKPMLSATLKLLSSASKLAYPAYISAKIDGIRIVTDANGVPHTRTLKPVMNQAILDEFAKLGLKLADGELGVGDPTSPEFFNITSGLVRRKYDNDFDKIDFYVFDQIGPGGYEDRHVNKPLVFNEGTRINVVRLTQKKVIDEDQLKGWEEYFVEQGWEGIMIRSNITADYKFGRPSINQGQLIKFKRFVDDEMVITGFVEAMENQNEKVINELGHSERSSHKENKVPKGMVGVILGSCDNFEGTVRIGTGIGLTHELKTDMWNNPHKYIGRTITFAYQDGTDYEKTRFGSFKGFRDDGI